MFKAAGKKKKKKESTKEEEKMFGMEQGMQEGAWWEGNMPQY